MDAPNEYFIFHIEFGKRSGSFKRKFLSSVLEKDLANFWSISRHVRSGNHKQTQEARCKNVEQWHNRTEVLVFWFGVVFAWICLLGFSLNDCVCFVKRGAKVCYKMCNNGIRVALLQISSFPATIWSDLMKETCAGASHYVSSLRLLWLDNKRRLERCSPNARRRPLLIEEAALFMVTSSCSLEKLRII